MRIEFKEKRVEFLLDSTNANEQSIADGFGVMMDNEGIPYLSYYNKETGENLYTLEFSGIDLDIFVGVLKKMLSETRSIRETLLDSELNEQIVQQWMDNKQAFDIRINAPLPSQENTHQEVEKTEATRTSHRSLNLRQKFSSPLLGKEKFRSRSDDTPKTFYEREKAKEKHEHCIMQ